MEHAYLAAGLTRRAWKLQISVLVTRYTHSSTVCDIWVIWNRHHVECYYSDALLADLLVQLGKSLFDYSCPKLLLGCHLGGNRQRPKALAQLETPIGRWIAVCLRFRHRCLVDSMSHWTHRRLISRSHGSVVTEDIDRGCQPAVHGAHGWPLVGSQGSDGNAELAK